MNSTCSTCWRRWSISRWCSRNRRVTRCATGFSNRRAPMRRRNLTMRASAISLRAAICAICATASRSCGNALERAAQRTDLVAALQTELEDVRFALDGALARSEVIDGGELLANIYMSWRAIGLEAEGMARCEAYLAALPADQSRLRARLSTALSYLLSTSGHKVRAFELATQAVEHARASGDDSLLAWALRVYAIAATFLNRFDEVERALTEAEAIAGNLGSPSH